MQSQPQHSVPQKRFSTPTKQPPYYSNNTTSNDNMTHFTGQNPPNSESENEKNISICSKTLHWYQIAIQNKTFIFLF